MNAQTIAVDYLRLLERSGYLLLPAQKQQIQKPAPAPEPAPKPELAPVSELDAKCAALSAIAADVAQCRQCELHKTRTNVVPGEGSPKAPIVFVGEAPGYDEDKSGRPFVGRAGDLLTKMIVAMHFRREDVFILNVIKCRPPENRDPQPAEMSACEGFLLKQLDIIQPKIIVALGRHAAQRLLNTTIPITRLRGQWAEYNGIPLMPTFHPSYLLRQESEKRKAWEDLQKVMGEYERLVGALPPKQ